MVEVTRTNIALTRSNYYGALNAIDLQSSRPHQLLPALHAIDLQSSRSYSHPYITHTAYGQDSLAALVAAWRCIANA